MNIQFVYTHKHACLCVCVLTGCVCVKEYVFVMFEYVQCVNFKALSRVCLVCPGV